MAQVQYNYTVVLTLCLCKGQAQGIGIEDKVWNDSIHIQITNAFPVNLLKFKEIHSIRTQIPFQLLQVVL